MGLQRQTLGINKRRTTRTTRFVSVRSQRSFFEGRVFLSAGLAMNLWLLITGISLIRAVTAFFVLIAVGCFGYQVLSFLLSRSAIISGATLWMLGPGVIVGSILLFGLRAVFPKNWFLATASLICLTMIAIELRELSRSVRGGERSPRDLLSRDFVQMTLKFFFLIGIPLARLWPWITPIVISAAIAAFVFQRLETTNFVGNITRFLVMSLLPISAFLSRQIRSDLWWMGADDNQYFEALSHSLIEWGPQERTTSIAGSGVAHVAYHHLAYFLSGLIDVFARGETYMALTRVMPVMVSACFVSSLMLVIRDLCATVSPTMILGDSRATLGVSYVLALSVPSPLSNFLGLTVLVCTALLSRYIVDSQRWSIRLPLVFLTLTALVFSKAPYLYAGVVILVVGAVFGLVKSWSVVIFTAVSSAILLLFFSLSSAASDYRIDPFNSNSVFELSEGRGTKFLALISVSAPLALGLVAGLAVMDWRGSRRVRTFVLSSLIVVVVGATFRLVVGGRIESIRYLFEPAILFASLLVAVWYVYAGKRVRRGAPGFSAGISIGVAAVWLLVVPEVVPNLNSGSTLAKLLRVIRDPNFAQVAFVAIGALLFAAQHLTRYARREPLGVDRSLANRIWQKLLFPVAVGVAIAISLPGLVESFSESRSGIQDTQRRSYIGSTQQVALARVIKERTASSDLIAVSLCDSTVDKCPTDYVLAAYSKRRFLSLGGSFVLSWGGNNQEILDYETSARIGAVPISNTLHYLKGREVGYLVVDKSAVNETWIDSANQNGIVRLYENSQFILYKL